MELNKTKKPSPHPWVVSFRKSGKVTASVTLKIIPRDCGGPLGGMLWGHPGRLSTLVYGLISRQDVGAHSTGHTRGSSEWTDLVEGKDLSSSSPQDLTQHLAQSWGLQIFIK